MTNIIRYPFPMPDDLIEQTASEEFITRGGEYAASGKFLIPLCVTGQEATRLLTALTFGAEALFTEWYLEVLQPYLQALDNIQAGQACDNDDFTDSHDCKDYSPNSFMVTYAPNDPFQTPNLTPDGYQAPPWKTFQSGDIPLTLTGLQAGDAIASRWAFEPNDWWEFVVPFAYFVENILSLPSLISSGFPRYKLHIQGEGTVELHMLSIPYGGDALILVDGVPNSQTRLVNLATFTLGSFVDLNEIIEAVMGFVFSEADAVQETIVEVVLTGDTAHTIDVVLLPHVDLAGDFGFGGGLRKVVLCKETLIGVENQMPQFDLENEVLRWKPNPDASWENLGQVIYRPSMREQSGEIQWTLQNLPIGGGADSTVEWIPLLTPASGQGIESVTVNMLANYDDEPTVDFTAGVLTLGLPPARGITDVTVSMLANGASPTASLTGETLALGIPAALDGQNAEMRVLDGQVQFKNEAASEWTNLISIDEISNATECGCSPVPLPSGNTSDNYRCGIAIGMQGYVWEMYAELQNQIALAESAADAVIGFFGAIPVIGWEVSSLYSIIENVNSLGQATLDAQDTLANREALQGAWYCLLNDDDALQDSEITAMRAAIDTELPEALATVIGQVFDAIPDTEKKRRAWLFAQSGNADNCLAFDCGGDDFCHLFDLTTMATLDPQLNPPEAVYPAFNDFVPYEGMRSGVYFDGYADLRRSGVIITVPAGVTVTSIRVKYAGHIGVSSFEIFEGSSYTRIHFVNYNENNFSEYTANLNVVGAGQPLEIVKTTEYLPRPNDGLQFTHHVLREIEVCGIGEDPWT